jgi:two-component system cell cycle sensor histidine kinase/response regulator CckA
MSVPVDQLLRDITERLMPIVGDRVQLEVASEPGVGSILVDPGLFESVILNLVVNARDALPEGGTIELLSEIAGGADCRRVNADDNYGAVRITVKDDGVGIEPEMLDKLFDPFFTTKREGEGTGLGLSTVYGVIDRSGGHVEATSAEKEGGASFTIVLPCVPSGQTEPTPATVPEPRTTLSGEHVLLVEDDEGVRHLLVTRLEILGLEIVAVRGMEDAFRAFSDIPRKFDLLITDVGLPDGSGVELAVWARTLFPRLPVLFVTGGAGLEARLNDMPLTTILRKPFTSIEIERALLDLLHSSAKESMTDVQPSDAGERPPDSL